MEISQWKSWYDLDLNYSELHSDCISQNILYQQILTFYLQMGSPAGKRSRLIGG